MLAAIQQNPILKSLAPVLPKYFLENMLLKTFGLIKVPMIGYLKCSLVEVNNQRCEVKIPLTRRSKNHLNCMYFGALSAGADCAGGFMSMYLIYQQKLPVSLIFKDFKADFLKRAEGDVHFISEDGQTIQKQLDEAMESGERVNNTVRVYAVVPSVDPNEVVANFELTLSIKKKSSK